MAKLSISDVDYIARLSRLDLSPAEKEKFANQLSSVLEYVELLREVDTEGVEPTAQVTGLTNISAVDQVKESENLDYRDISQNSPEFKGGAFVVPGVFE